jgi:PKD repeat protein
MPEVYSEKRWPSGALTAAFSGSPTSGIDPILVEFTNESISDFDTCAWDFGDGGSSDSCINPSHMYTIPGVYTVSLSISGFGGTDTATISSYILVDYGVFLPAIISAEDR